MPQTFLTFDIEEWYHANYPGLEISAETKSRPTNVVALVDRLLEICELQKVRATFFVVGELAQKKPEIVRRIVAGGHELAAHSLHHDLVSLMGSRAFLEDCTRTKAILEDIGGAPVLGYRAPSWSVTADTLSWYADGLSQAGYRYSSSVFPAKTFLYGIDGAPRQPHFLTGSDGSQEILEIPCSVVELGPKTIGFSGGAYLRLFPEWLIRQFIQQVHKEGLPAVLYLHPREIDPHQPQLSLPWLTHFLHYVGVAGAEAKLVSLIHSERTHLTQTLGDARFQWRRDLSSNA